MIRCKPLLGTYVEISVDQGSNETIKNAFAAIEQVQSLMSFHNPNSELSQINAKSHLEPVEIHDWTLAVLSIAKDIHQASNGLFDCGVGAKLQSASLLPNHHDNERTEYGSLENLTIINSNKVRSNKPLRLDLGGIAKGFAVDKAVEILMQNGISSGCVNAGGDLRVFGKHPRPVHIRNPRLPGQLLAIGSLQNGAIATSALYFANRDRQDSHIINPLTRDQNKVHLNFSESYSIVASECVYADALTKVLALCGGRDHACFDYFNAQAIKIAA
jgi:thiamine biosynthesis lipoprotein